MELFNFFDNLKVDLTGVNGVHSDFPSDDYKYIIDHFVSGCAPNTSFYFSYPLMLKFDDSIKFRIPKEFDAFTLFRVDLLPGERLARARLHLGNTLAKTIEFFGDDTDTFQFCQSPLYMASSIDAAIVVDIVNAHPIGNRRRLIMTVFIFTDDINRKCSEKAWAIS